MSLSNGLERIDMEVWFDTREEAVEVVADMSSLLTYTCRAHKHANYLFMKIRFSESTRTFYYDKNMECISKSEYEKKRNVFLVSRMM